MNPFSATFGAIVRTRNALYDRGVIPVERTDRGGQVTYHGPGQLIVYVLLDLNRRHLRVRALVSALEQAVINCVARAGIEAGRVSGAPGVYVAERKLAAKCVGWLCLSAQPTRVPRLLVTICF